ncbi:MAG: RNA polymerase factor sigma-54, partial [Bryobacteraceae bacterium]
MSLLSPREQLRVAQKQILTPGLVQMVTVLQLNRLELKEMISQEMALNPVLEESAEAGEELTPEEVQAMLETERVTDPADQPILDTVSDAVNGQPDIDPSERLAEAASPPVDTSDGVPPSPAGLDQPEPKQESDPFEEIDFGSFFDDYLDPGYKTPSAE